jgi:hypothetical protein
VQGDLLSTLTTPHIAGHLSKKTVFNSRDGPRHNLRKGMSSLS